MNSSNTNVPKEASYKVFVILATLSTSNPGPPVYKSVCVGQCDNPSSAALLVGNALREQTIVDPAFVLLVPESHIEVPFSK